MRLESPYSFPDTLDAPSDCIEANGIRCFDHRHQAAAQSVGLNMPPTSVIVLRKSEGRHGAHAGAPTSRWSFPFGSSSARTIERKDICRLRSVGIVRGQARTSCYV